MVPQTENPSAAVDHSMREWLALSNEADQVIGYSLIGGKENEQTLDLLVGVPFIIEGITFRQGDVNIMPKGEAPFYRDYASVEALVHPLFQGRFKRPRVVFNDGSTGIYRQLTQYLAAKGIIEVDDAYAETGEANGTRYDVSLSGPGFKEDATTREDRAFTGIRLVCPEGLRVSDYRNAYGEGKTWYLA
jgi:hypothetical protein